MLQPRICALVHNSRSCRSRRKAPFEQRAGERARGACHGGRHALSAVRGARTRRATQHEGRAGRARAARCVRDGNRVGWRRVGARAAGRQSARASERVARVRLVGMLEGGRGMRSPPRADAHTCFRRGSCPTLCVAPTCWSSTRARAGPRAGAIRRVPRSRSARRCARRCGPGLTRAIRRSHPVRCARPALTARDDSPGLCCRRHRPLCLLLRTGRGAQAPDCVSRADPDRGRRRERGHPARLRGARLQVQRLLKRAAGR